mgnify:CR=1 FL=1
MQSNDMSIAFLHKAVKCIFDQFGSRGGGSARFIDNPLINLVGGDVNAIAIFFVAKNYGKGNDINPVVLAKIGRQSAKHQPHFIV